MARTASTTSTAVALLPPSDFTGTRTQWRVLTETIWPSARSSESIQLALGYCAARKLDPFKRPVHIVPMYNTRLRREVETVWPGINELLTTAARSHAFAGVDEPVFGPDQTHTFHGTDDNDREISVTVTFPVSCSVRVWRQVQGERRGFSQPVYWMETYRRRGFRSELPNSMWEQRPFGQLHKCALAAALRIGFPEDLGSEYAAEEMEGGEIDHGGVVIDGKAEATTTTQRDRQANAAYPPDDRTGSELRLALLDESNGTQWFKNLLGLLDAAASEDQVHEIAGHSSVHNALAPDSKAPPLIRQNIIDALAKARARFKPADDEASPESTAEQQTWDTDPIGDLLLEIAGMDLVTVTGLQANAAWRAKVRDAVSFPPDEDRINEAIEARKLALKAQGGKA
jgi:phage recombination protein Bet